MKHFVLHWNFGKTEYIKGNSISDAFMKAGYGDGALAALDYHEEVSEIPIDKKEVLFQSKTDTKPDTVGTMFINQVREQTSNKETNITVRICNKSWECAVSYLPFSIVCVEV